MHTSQRLTITCRRSGLLSLVGLTCLISAGCGGSSDGPALYHVTGTVTFAGEPVKSGRIQFRADEGAGTAYSAEITDGEYELEAVPGKMKVEIIASREVPGKMGEAASPDEKPVPVMEMFIPEKYNTKSTLVAEVTEGKNTIPFSLDKQ